MNLDHPPLATGTRETECAMVTETDGSKRPLTARHAPADLTEAWEQIAFPEDVLHGALEADGGGYGGGFGAGASLGDG